MANFCGLPYPITKDSLGYFRSQCGPNTVKGDLLMLLLTNPGERVMMPDFGTGLRKLVFDPNDFIIKDRAKSMIIDAITAWEPRIAVEQIDVYTGAEASESLSPSDDLTQADNSLIVRIIFVEKDNINELQELILTVPLESNV